MHISRSRRAAPRRPETSRHLSAAAMSALLLTSAWHHFRNPRFYRQVVPGFLCREDVPAVPTPAGVTDDAGSRPSAERPSGLLSKFAVLSKEEWIAVSGLLELAAAVGILVPRTRKPTATALTAMFTVFLAGHVEALRRAYGPRGTPVQRKIHTLRLPLQAPLIAWAWSLRKAGTQGRVRL